MPASQVGISANTPMGATLVPGGATFRVWAPRAEHGSAVGGAGGVAGLGSGAVAQGAGAA